MATGNTKADVPTFEFQFRRALHTRRGRARWCAGERHVNPSPPVIGIHGDGVTVEANNLAARPVGAPVPGRNAGEWRPTT
jgi:hypothetical protein